MRKQHWLERKEIWRIFDNKSALVGGVEPDSLMFLCDGEDNDVLSYIMDYLAFEDVGRCEIVCNTLKNQSKHIWGKFDERYLKDQPTRQSPSARGSREKVIQHHLASTLARRIGTLGDSIAKYPIIAHYDRFAGTITERRVQDCCQGCDFPDLDFALLDRDTANDYEIFLRFSRTNDNKLFAEGFAPPPEREGDFSIKIDLKQMDFSGWQDILEVNRQVLLDGDDYVKDHHNFLIRCMKELTVIIVAVHKVSCKASLVIAQSNFGDGRSEDGAGIDNMEGHGFCWPTGKLCPRSHGDVETEISGYDHPVWHKIRESHAKLGMLYDTYTWRDPEDTNRILKKECGWILDCDFSLRDNGDGLDETLGDGDY